MDLALCTFAKLPRPRRGPSWYLLRRVGIFLEGGGGGGVGGGAEGGEQPGSMAGHPRGFYEREVVIDNNYNNNTAARDRSSMAGVSLFI